MMKTLRRLWFGSPPLVATAVLMLPALLLAAAGLALDPRLVTGAPAWLKPAKFAASIAIYTLTLAWIFSLIPGWTRTRRVVSWTTAAALLVEIVIIDLQAFRGTASHFNVATPLDAALFGVMGAAIFVQTFTSIAVAVALWRHRFADRALGVALRAGMTITIVGALTGGLMTRPTAAQLEAMRGGERMTVAGAHTVGAADGGRGLPVTGWSRDHGDLRVAHFVGLHALQALPILALVLRWRRVRDGASAGLVKTAAWSYAALFGILLSQALRGQSVLAPDVVTIGLLAAWAVLTAGGAAAALLSSRFSSRTGVGGTTADVLRGDRRATVGG